MYNNSSSSNSSSSSSSAIHLELTYTFDIDNSLGNVRQIQKMLVPFDEYYIYASRAHSSISIVLFYDSSVFIFCFLTPPFCIQFQMSILYPAQNASDNCGLLTLHTNVLALPTFVPV